MWHRRLHRGFGALCLPLLVAACGDDAADGAGGGSSDDGSSEAEGSGGGRDAGSGGSNAEASSGAGAGASQGGGGAGTTSSQTGNTSSPASSSSSGGDVCASGERACEEGVLRVCVGGAFEETACASGCAGDEACASGTQPGAPWPAYKGGVGHRSTLANVGPTTGEITFTATMTPLGGASPDGVVIAADGTIYVTTASGSMTAVGPDGETRWTRDDVRYTPVIGPDGTIYAGGYEGLCAIDPEDGESRWCAADVAATHTTVGQDGTIYAGYDIIQVVHPDGSLGPVWDDLEGYPTIYDLAVGATGLVFALNGNGDLAAFHPDGDIEWDSLETTANLSIWGVVLGADESVTLSIDRYVIRLDRDGELVFSTAIPEAYFVSDMSVGADGSTYVATVNGELHDFVHAFHPDGTHWWSYELPTSGMQAPLVDSEGTVYVVASGCQYVSGSYSCTENGRLLRFDVQPDGESLTAEPTWDVELPASSSESDLAFRGDELILVTDDWQILGFGG